MAHELPIRVHHVLPVEETDLELTKIATVHSHVQGRVRCTDLVGWRARRV